MGVLLEEDLRYLWLVEHLGLKGPLSVTWMRCCQRMGEGGVNLIQTKALCCCTQGPSLPSLMEMLEMSSVALWSLTFHPHLKALPVLTFFF